MTNPVRALDALELQGLRDIDEVQKINVWKASQNSLRLMKLAADLQELGFLGLGNGVSLQDVQAEIDAAFVSFLQSSEFSNALTDYITSDTLSTALNNYVTSGQLTNALYAYVTQDERAQDLATYVTNSALTTTLTNYVTNGSLAASLTSYVSTTDLNAALANYVTSGALTTTLSNYVTNSALNNAIADFVTSTALSTTLNDYVTSTALTSALSSYVTNASLSTNLQNYITSGALTASLANYVTSGALTTALSAYVTSAALTTALSAYVTSAALTSTLANYAKRGTTNNIAATNDALNCTNVVLNGTDNIAINCKNLTTNASQNNSIFENINLGGAVILPRFNDGSVIKALTGLTNFGKKLIVEAAYTNTKLSTANSVLVFNNTTTGLLKPYGYLTLGSSENKAVHEIDVVCSSYTGQFAKIIVLCQGANINVINVTNLGNITLTAAPNATDSQLLDITISAGGGLASAQATFQTVIKSTYHL